MLLVAANFPDADFLFGFLSSETYMLWHRGLTHSVTGLVIFPPALAALASGLSPKLSFSRALLLCEAGFLSHIALDLPTSWGTLALYPWSRERFALDWVFIIDPVLWVLPAAGILAGLRRSSRGRRRAAAGALALAGLYVAGAGVVHGEALERARATLASAGRPAEERAQSYGDRGGVSGDRITVKDIEVLPRPLSPARWHAVAWSGDSLIHLSLEGLPPRVTAIGSEPHGLAEPAIRPALFSAPGQAFLWWAKAPAGRVLRREPGRTVVALSDRRFAARGGDLFGMEIAIGEGGEYLGATWEGDSVFRRQVEADSRGRLTWR